MRWPTFTLLLAAVAVAQDTTTTSSTESGTTTESSTVKSVTTPVALPSGTYQEVSTTITLGDGETSIVASPTHYNGTMTASNQTVFTTTSDSLTFLVGGGRTSVIGNNSMNATATATSTSTKEPVVNTRPCNDYPEFCTRKYSNITMIAAHNSPFVRPNNLGANQALDVTQQLNDGVRMCKYRELDTDRTTTDARLSAIPNSLRERHYVPLPHDMRFAERRHPRSILDRRQQMDAQ
jgi:hypothetical protein